MPDNRIKMSSVRQKFPMYEDLSDDDLLIALHKKFYTDIPAGQFFRSVDYDTQRRELQKPENLLPGANWGERAGMNFQAGIDTLRQGGQQLASYAGLGTGPTDAEIEEKRAIDRTLSDSTAGGSTMQIAGEVVPTMVGAALAGPAAGALGLSSLAARVPLLAKTIATVASKVPPMGPLTKTAALGGGSAAASSTISPVTSEESRLGNAALAGVAGTVAPPLAGGAAKSVGKGWRVLTGTDAAKRARDFISENMPVGYVPNLGRVVDDTVDIHAPTDTGYGSKVFRPQQSAAQVAGDPQLAQLEAFSRSRPTTTPHWTQFDSARNAELHRATQEMAPSDLRLSRLRAVREGRTGPLRERALEEAAQQGNFAQPVLAHVDSLIQGASGANPAVSTIADYVQRVIGPDARGAVSPERLYEVRKVLTDKLGKTGMGDELGSAAKTARRETVGIVKAIDQALDDATGNQWTPYLREYSQRSGPITSGTALRDVAEDMAAKPIKGVAPEVTYAGYKRALDANTPNQYGGKLMPGQVTATQRLSDTLRHGEAVGRTRKITATMGGGSITNTDQMLGKGMLGALDLVSPGVRVGSRLTSGAQFLDRLNQEAVERRVADLLMQPTLLAAELRKMSPNARLETIARMMNASGGAAAGTAITP